MTTSGEKSERKARIADMAARLVGAIDADADPNGYLCALLVAAVVLGKNSDPGSAVTLEKLQSFLASFWGSVQITEDGFSI